MLKKFNFSDIFINRIKTYPKTRILTHSGSMYYNNNNTIESSVSLYNFLSAELPSPPTPAIPLPSDYWHVSNSDYSASAYAPQQSYIGTGGSSFSLLANQVVFMPFFVGRLGRTVTQMGLRTTVAPTLPASVKIGIYDCLPAHSYDIYPRNLIADVTFACTNTIGVQTAPLAAPVFLSNGLYWIAVARGSTNTITCRALNGTGFGLTAERNPLQWNTNGTSANTHLRFDLTYATPLPAIASSLSGTLLVANTGPQVEIL